MTKGWKIGVVALAVGIGTYVGLKLLLPHHKTEVAMTGLVPADSVFGAQLKPSTEIAAADASVAAAPAPSSSVANTGDATVAAAAAPTATASSTAENATPPPAAAPAPEAAPVAEPTPPPAPEPEAKPAARPAAKRTPAKAPASTASVVSSAAPASPWWQTDGGDGLHVIYAGSAAYRRAIVVMGNAPFADAAAVGQNIQVVDGHGKRVVGNWEVNHNNPAMLVLPVDRNGLYQLTIGAALSDAKGRTLGRALNGAVTVE